MNIVIASSEALPFSKTGGLGDVAGALPHAVAALGHQVRVVTPYYKAAHKVDPSAQVVAEGAVPVGTEMVPWKLCLSSLNHGKARQYLIHNDKFFDREGIYGNRQGDYKDACARFIFFCRAVLASSEALNEPVDVYHCNDWQTAMIPVYLKLSFSEHPFHGPTKSVFTIHNLAYQGLFWHWDWPQLNLPWKHFNWKELEFHGKINLLKGALVHADIINTVSPSYAREIQTKEFGCGLDGVMKERGDVLFGVVNGIDTKQWDPENDELLPARYSAKDLSGKKDCRRALLQSFELPDKDQTPVIGMVGRLFEQKGFDLVAGALEAISRRDIKLVILGTGDEKYHQLLRRMRELYPETLGVAFAFDNKLAHLIEAGSDIFLMPSRFEPCGLSQLYALRYGTIPLVHSVGGLADTVVDASAETIENETATGFAFREFNTKALLETLDRALLTFKRESQVWSAMQQRGMLQDWSWESRAHAYVKLYEQAVSGKGKLGM